MLRELVSGTLERLDTARAANQEPVMMSIDQVAVLTKKHEASLSGAWGERESAWTQALEKSRVCLAKVFAAVAQESTQETKADQQNSLTQLWPQKGLPTLPVHPMHNWAAPRHSLAPAASGADAVTRSRHAQAQGSDRRRSRQSRQQRHWSSRMSMSRSQSMSL
jgi:hypothetical protein